MPVNFISGLDLSRLFFEEIIEPLLQEKFPDIKISAALSGDGSEVLGYDDATSADHDWGPRLHLFIPEAGFGAQAEPINAMLDRHLPHKFMEYSVSFDDRDRQIGLDINRQCCGSLKHGVEIFTVRSFFRKYLQVDVASGISDLTWLALPEQLLLATTSGKVFRDDTGALSDTRKKLQYFPDDVWLHMLSCQWVRIAQEQPFVGRCGDAGDELGSAIIAARLVRDLMRLCFLMERQYAPYPKWFGTAFSRLPHSRKIAALLRRVMETSTWRDRESALCEAYLEAGQLHRQVNIPGDVQAAIGSFHGRPYRVVNADDFAAAIRQQITKSEIRDLDPKCGSIDQLSDSTDILCHPGICQSVVTAIHSR